MFVRLAYIMIYYCIDQMKDNFSWIGFPWFPWLLMDCVFTDGGEYFSGELQDKSLSFIFLLFLGLVADWVCVSLTDSEEEEEEEVPATITANGI